MGVHFPGSPSELKWIYLQYLIFNFLVWNWNILFVNSLFMWNQIWNICDIFFTAELNKSDCEVRCPCSEEDCNLIILSYIDTKSQGWSVCDVTVVDDWLVCNEKPCTPDRNTKRFRRFWLKICNVFRKSEIFNQNLMVHNIIYISEEIWPMLRRFKIFAFNTQDQIIYYLLTEPNKSIPSIFS